MDGETGSGAPGPARRAEAQAVNLADNAFVFDDFDVTRFVELARNFGESHYGYVVTPNVDHLVRLQQQPRFAQAYNQASYVLLDSRLLARLLRWRRNIEIATCPGSDLTQELFRTSVLPQDRIVLIGGSLTQARELGLRFGLERVAHFNPTMGFIERPDEVEQVLRFVESHSPFRYCLLAIGSPQQEYIAQELQVRGYARGLTLCVGASVNFLTGGEKRAPLWMQQRGLEWLYRVLQNPQRLLMRYLRAAPGLVRLMRGARFAMRSRPTPVRGGDIILPRQGLRAPADRSGSVHPASLGQTG